MTRAGAIPQLTCVVSGVGILGLLVLTRFEVATTLAEQLMTEVTLAYRGDAFSRAKPKNRERVDAAVSAGRLQLLLRSGVAEITPTEVYIETESGPKTLANDAVIVCAGGVLPTGFLQSIGIAIETKYGTA